MNIYGVIGALLLAVILTSIFSRSFRHRGPLGGLLLFCIIVFLAAWAGQLWINPIGPIALGIAWLPFTFVAISVALLLVAAASGDRKPAAKNPEPVPQEAVPFMAIGLFFWLLLLFFLIAILLGYYIVPGGRTMAL